MAHRCHADERRNVCCALNFGLASAGGGTAAYSALRESRAIWRDWVGTSLIGKASFSATKRLLKQPRPLSISMTAVRTIQQPLLVAVSPNHRLAGRKELEGERVCILDRSFGIRHLLDQLVKDSNAKIIIRMETNSIHMVRQFATREMGIVFLPMFSFEAEVKAGDLVGIPLNYAGLPKASLKICKRRETELFQPASKLVDYLDEAAGAR